MQKMNNENKSPEYQKGFDDAKQGVYGGPLKKSEDDPYFKGWNDWLKEEFEKAGR